MIAALSTQPNRNRSLVLLTVSVVSGIGAAALGIDDNPPGILLAYLAATAFVLVFAHPWRTPRPFLRLLLASFLALFASLLLDILLDVSASNLGGATAILDFVEAVFTPLFLIAVLVFPAGMLVGAVGAAVMAIRNRRQRRPGPTPPA